MQHYIENIITYDPAARLDDMDHLMDMVCIRDAGLSLVDDTHVHFETMLTAGIHRISIAVMRCLRAKYI